MKLPLSIFFLLLVSYTWGQSNHFYWPDGKPFITKENNIKSHSDSLKLWEPHTFSYKQTIVFFYPLSSRPAYLLTDNPREIFEALKAYKPSAYKYSEFKEQLMFMVGSKMLDTTYVLKSMGKPDLRINNKEGNMWMFKKRKVSLFLQGEMVDDYEFYMEQ